MLTERYVIRYINCLIYIDAPVLYTHSNHHNVNIVWEFCKVWLLITAIPELRRLRNKEFEVSPGFIARLCLKDKQNRKTKSYMKILTVSKKVFDKLNIYWRSSMWTVFIFIGINRELYNLETLLEGTTIEMRLWQLYDR